MGRQKETRDMDPKAALGNYLSEDSTPEERIEAKRAYNAWTKGGGLCARVELHPATDAWMKGDRYGAVQSIGRKYLIVLCDWSDRRLHLLPRNVAVI